MKIIIWKKIFLLIPALIIFSCSNQVTRLVHKGDKYADSSDVEEIQKAVSAYKSAINAKIDAADRLVYVYQRLGNIYMSRSMWDLAIENFQFAVKYMPEKAVLHHNLGVCYANKGNLYSDNTLLKKAEQEYRIALKIDRSRYLTHYALGVLLAFKFGKYKEGIDEFEETIELKKNFYDAYFAIARAEYEQGNLKQALIEYKKLQKVMPDNNPKIFDLKKMIERIYNELDINHE